VDVRDFRRPEDDVGLGEDDLLSGVNERGGAEGVHVLPASSASSFDRTKRLEDNKCKAKSTIPCPGTVSLPNNGICHMDSDYRYILLVREECKIARIHGKGCYHQAMGSRLSNISYMRNSVHIPAFV
jgi:hypothetical protein